MLNKEQAKELIVNECNKIKNETIKDAVLRTIDFIPDYFYEVPSSSSGKYHPADEICEGGLVIHTLKDVKLVEVLAQMNDLSEYEKDLCKAALILHDCSKSGRNRGSKYTVFEHPILAAELVIECNRDIRANLKEAKKIAKLIKSHMGRWNTDKHSSIRLPKPKTKLEKFVHLCDFIASRKEIEINVSRETL